MMTNQEKIDFIYNRIDTLNSDYNKLCLEIKEKNDGEIGSKEWCELARVDLNNISLSMDALNKELDALTQ
jgi:hypothetical protein